MVTAQKTNERLLNIYLTLVQYPIMSSRIRARMRERIFEKNVLSFQEFEARVRESAMQSKKREGLLEVTDEEPETLWEMRLGQMRDQVTDLIFSQSFSQVDFDEVIRDVLSERAFENRDLILKFNPELASLDMVFEHIRAIENLPHLEQDQLQARLEESKVVLIRSMITDQLRYINIAKEWMSVGDLEDIHNRKVGSGRIGGKAAGMLLAYHILRRGTNPILANSIRIPESYFIGSSEFYTFMATNNLTHWLDQKYKTEDEMRHDYIQLAREFEAGEFPSDVKEQLRVLLEKIGKFPLIVRSSSLLEDNFGTAFAGKYESIFIPNQGSLEDNLNTLTRGIARVYASALNPHALLYRRQRGLQDYDERMSILMQVVEGEVFNHYYLPHGAGVAFSRNIYRWNPQIRSEDGFVRLVWGLGTRAVDRVGNDYPRLIALSHPLLRPSTDPKSIRRYSQQFVDLIDLENNQLKTFPIHDILNGHYFPLRYLAQLDEDGYFTSLRSNLIEGDPSNLVLTFDELLRRTPFAEQMREILCLLEKTYHDPVDMEFAINLRPTIGGGSPHLFITILQCRPQSRLEESSGGSMPICTNKDDIIFSTRFVVPQGQVERIYYVIYVPPEAYFSLETASARNELAHLIGRLNAALLKETFICIGPGRWGSSNSDLGVPVDYGDIYNARAMVELAGDGFNTELEPSLGTHFFQDLMEGQIFPLGIFLNDPNSIFQQKFFDETPNHVEDWIKLDEKWSKYLRLIRVADFRTGHHLHLVMKGEEALAMAFLEKD
jgi:hypothetical protein